jgi:hypothetical protein
MLLNSELQSILGGKLNHMFHIAGGDAHVLS